MNFLDKHHQMERLKEWLRKGRAGNVDDLTKAFKVSSRTIKRWIADLRQYEQWDIEFCRKRNKYLLKEKKGD